MKFPKIDFEGFKDDLKALPTIAFALMLGAGMVMTALACWLIVILAYGSWPSSMEVAVARIDKLGYALLVCLGLIGLVIVALAFGKIKNISGGNGIVSASVSFDSSSEKPQDPPF